MALFQEWTHGRRTDGTPRLQSEVLAKTREWLLGTDEGAEANLADWDISRDEPYFGIPIPDAPGKYFYVWLDAPVGYLASLKAYCRAQGLDFDTLLAPDGDTEQVHFIGKDIIYFHALFWPAMLKFSGRKIPDMLHVHGFITVSGEKMSKSRGTGISPLRYLDIGMDAEWLRYYIAAKLNAHVEDLDFNPDDFVARVNSDLIGKVRQHRQSGDLLHHPPLRRRAGLQRRHRRAAGRTARLRRAGPGRLRGARVRPRHPPHHGPGRQDQPGLRHRPALGAGQKAGAAGFPFCFFTGPVQTGGV